MARAVEEQLTRSRRTALLVVAVVLAVPVGFATRGLGDWATVGVAAALLAALMIFGTNIVFGPFGRDTSRLDDTPPEDTPGRSLLRRDPGEQQLVLSTRRRAAGSSARTRDE